ncbi:uncharacterized protein BYT42DRAFT_501423 [Radiomyces spectabilis]|uniref:uncharacterized protein n=1 Tax=Radiomyces spectabilis TaxID=64574 RepID=UPI002220860E|nr:uncharacterized protein BYT42DRAFT_501423 [Radiomyces spectabilis]KAI8371358.1 hypothetical protein BYT42DRAFT_501423 [Radiomyces spectabilis]
MPSEDDRVRQLLQLFPGGDPIYFRECLRYYREDQVAHVVEKVVANHYYPRTTHAEMNSMEHLNDVLHTLATEIFPDCDIGYLRDLVEKYNHSHLEQVALEVISQPNYPERLNYGEFDRIYTIRKPHYQHQTLEQLSKEFPHIWKSSIRAMLTEHHWDYISTREALKHFQRPGFTKSIHTLCEHWIGAFFESQAGSTTMRQALNPVLANEMEQVRRQEEVPRINDQVARDQQLALRWNTEQYEKKGQLITCLCCIDEYTFEEMAYCSEGNHAFCHDCITRFVSEKMFGQGALNNELRLPCICMDGCSGWISQETLERVVPDDIWRAYEKFMFERNLQQLRLRIVQCKSCNYCELDDTIAPLHVGVQRGQRLLRKVQWTMVAPVLALGFYSPPILVAGGLLAASCWMIARQWDPSNDLKEAYEQILFQRRGTAFRCGNPECRKLTCLQCHREMRGIHKCRENNVDNLRLYVERAMDNAIKRTVSEIMR